MLTFDELKTYASDHALEGLVSIEPTFSAPKAVLQGSNDSFSFGCVKLVETYVLFDENKVDELITKAKESPLFAYCSKTFTDAKTNKEGEIVKDAYWKIRIAYKNSDY